jgi:hypothetical protein
MISKAGGTKRYMAPELLAKKSPILYDTIKKNIVEQEIFDLIEKHKIAEKAQVLFQNLRP